MQVTKHFVNPFCFLLHQSAFIEKEKREGWQKRGGKRFEKLGDTSQRKSREPGLVSRAEDQSHETKRQKGNSVNPYIVNVFVETGLIFTSCWGCTTTPGLALAR